MWGQAQAMLPALEAILGQRSAHSLATGPVMADPEEQVSRGVTTTAGLVAKQAMRERTARLG